MRVEIEFEVEATEPAKALALVLIALSCPRTLPAVVRFVEARVGAQYERVPPAKP